MQAPPRARPGADARRRRPGALPGHSAPGARSARVALVGEAGTRSPGPPARPPAEKLRRARASASHARPGQVASQAGLGQDHRVELAVERLVQAGLDVPSNAHDRSGRAGRGATAPASGASRSRPWLRAGKASRVKAFGRAIRASATSSRTGTAPRVKPVGAAGREVFQAMDGDLDEPFDQGSLDLLGEQPGASDRGQRRVPVARSPCVLISISSTARPG